MDRNSAQCLMIIPSNVHPFPQNNFIKGFPKEKNPSKPILSKPIKPNNYNDKISNPDHKLRLIILLHIKA